jgi:hypothetical protein
MTAIKLKHDSFLSGSGSPEFSFIPQLFIGSDDSCETHGMGFLMGE